MSRRKSGWRYYLVGICLFVAGVWSVPALADGVFRFPLFYVPSSLDPVKDELVDTYHIIQQVYDGLVAFDSNLRIIPGLAESWTVSRDGKKYVFRIRKGVRFHNGKELTVDDVTASLTRLFEPVNVTSSKEYLNRIKGGLAFKEGKAAEIEGIKALSDTEIMIELTEPYAPFLSVLAMPMAKIVPEPMAKVASSSLEKQPVGTGPFSFSSWTDGVITLKANNSYFNGAPELEEVKFVFYPGEKRDQAFPDFLAGKLDGCPLPGSADVKELRDRGYLVLIRPRISLLFYGINVNKPPLGDAEIRRALSLALDRDTISREIMKSKYPPARQIFPPGMPGYSPDNAVAVFDPDKARKLIAMSNYAKSNDMPEILIASASQSDLAKAELELYRQNLAELGFKLKPIFVESWEIFKKEIEEGKYHLYRYAFYADIPDPDDFLPNLVETRAAHNFTGYSNPKVDAIIKKARGEPDTLKRMSLYRGAERMVLEDSPLIPVIFLSTQVAFRPSVHNIDLPATGTPYLALNKVTISDNP